MKDCVTAKAVTYKIKERNLAYAKWITKMMKEKPENVKIVKNHFDLFIYEKGLKDFLEEND